jgi:hypothetical protein
LNDKEIDKIVNSQFRFAKEKIEELNNNNLNRDNKYNFNNIIFYFKRIGKIYLNNINNK